MSAPSIRSKWTGDDTMGLIAEYDAILEQRDQLFETAQAYREANRSARAQLAQITAERDELRAACNAMLPWLNAPADCANPNDITSIRLRAESLLRRTLPH